MKFFCCYIHSAVHPINSEKMQEIIIDINLINDIKKLLKYYKIFTKDIIENNIYDEGGGKSSVLDKKYL